MIASQTPEPPDSDSELDLEDMVYGVFQNERNELLVAVNRVPNSLEEIGQSLADLIDTLLDFDEEAQGQPTPPEVRAAQAGSILAIAFEHLGLSGDDDDDDEGTSDGELD
jgi:hypothetical protein